MDKPKLLLVGSGKLSINDLPPIYHDHEIITVDIDSTVHHNVEKVKDEILEKTRSIGMSERDTYFEITAIPRIDRCEFFEEKPNYITGKPTRRNKYKYK